MRIIDYICICAYRGTVDTIADKFIELLLSLRAYFTVFQSPQHEAIIHAHSTLKACYSKSYLYTPQRTYFYGCRIVDPAVVQEMLAVFSAREMEYLVRKSETIQIAKFNGYWLQPMNSINCDGIITYESSLQHSRTYPIVVRLRLDRIGTISQDTTDALLTLLHKTYSDMRGRMMDKSIIPFQPAVKPLYQRATRGMRSLDRDGFLLCPNEVVSCNTYFAPHIKFSQELLNSLAELQLSHIACAVIACENSYIVYSHNTVTVLGDEQRSYETKSGRRIMYSIVSRL